MLQNEYYFTWLFEQHKCLPRLWSIFYYWHHTTTTQWSLLNAVQHTLIEKIAKVGQTFRQLAIGQWFILTCRSLLTMKIKLLCKSYTSSSLACSSAGSPETVVGETVEFLGVKVINSSKTFPPWFPRDFFFFFLDLPFPAATFAFCSSQVAQQKSS